MNKFYCINLRCNIDILRIITISLGQAKDNSFSMENKEQLFTISKPRWEWHKVNSELRTFINAKHFCYPLRSNLTFQGKNSDGTSVKLQFKASIDTEKSLQFENQVGWNWHKSSNLPLISLKTELRHPQTNTLLPLPQTLKARIFAVKVVSNSLGREKISYLQDVGMRGETQIQIKGGCGIFSGIKFLTTSYNNEGVKFHLLVVAYSKDDSKQNCQLKNIIFSAISSPIFVDSRKSARDYQQKRFLSFVQIFDPLLMKKEFSKKPFILKGEFETKITNNTEGLFNYLTASNIHHKVKHPLFLTVKFSNAFNIFFNTKHTFFKNEIPTITELIFKLQKCLIKELGNNSEKAKISLKNGKVFIISVVPPMQFGSYKKSKIWECLEFLDCKDIEFVKSQEEIGQNFKNISELGDVAKAYNDCFQDLVEMTNKQMENRKSNMNFMEDNEKFENKISSTEPKKSQKSVEYSNSCSSPQLEQDLALKANKSNISSYQEINSRKQSCIKLNSPGNRILDKGLLRPNFQQLQVRNLLQKAASNSFFNFNPQLSIQNQLNQINPIGFQNLIMQNQLDLLRYYQPLICQIEFQNNMLEAIVKQNMIMRENLSAIMMQNYNLQNQYKSKSLPLPFSSKCSLQYRTEIPELDSIQNLEQKFKLFNQLDNMLNLKSKALENSSKGDIFVNSQNIIKKEFINITQ